VAIVGGGAAGIFAALAAREAGATAVLYERNKRPGIKILISGGGKCNITHDASPREMAEGFIPREARFLRYALHELTSSAVLDALHAEGVETFTRPNGRVFPVSGRAEDVLAAFERMMARAGVEIRTSALVEGIVVDDGSVKGIMVDGVMERCDAAIVATGGMSYRKVGTTGDGIRWGAALGHAIEPVRAALAPIYFPVPPPADWQGVALRDVLLWCETEGARPKLPRAEAPPVAWRDDLLLTHRGLSGPAALEVSRVAARVAEDGSPVTLLVDLLPDMPPDELRIAWERRAASAGRSEVQSFVEGYLPRALVRYFLDAAGVPAGTKLSEVTREGRLSILGALKGWRIGEVGEVPIDRGEVTAGGISLAQISPTTMESQLVRGLHVAGEALDISGRVGGYNLQAAFSTGYVAGRAAGRVDNGDGS
jgi:predicted Rossmann fold flavoprotein